MQLCRCEGGHLNSELNGTGAYQPQHVGSFHQCYRRKVGGCEKRLEEARPVLNTFASKVVHMGATGNGQLAKALNNCLAPQEALGKTKLFVLQKQCSCDFDE